MKTRDKMIEKLENSSISDLLTMCRALNTCAHGWAKKEDLINHLIAHYDQFETSASLDQLQVQLRARCKNRSNKIKKIINKYQHKSSLYEKNLLQATTMGHSAISKIDWVKKYAKRFDELYEAGEHDLKEIEKQLYKN